MTKKKISVSVANRKARRMLRIMDEAIKTPLRVAGVTTPRAGETHLVLPGGELVATFHTCSPHPSPKAFRRRVASARLAAHAMEQLLPLCVAVARSLKALSGHTYNPEVCAILKALEQQLVKAYKVL